MEEGDHLEDLDLDGKIILKIILNEELWKDLDWNNLSLDGDKK